MAVRPKARTVGDYRATYDLDVIVPNKIRAGLAELLKIGPEHYEFDEGFRSLCGLQAAQLSAYRDMFRNHWFFPPTTNGHKNPKRVWFGNAKVAARLRPTPAEKE